MWKCAAAWVCARLPCCRFRAGAGSTEFSKFSRPSQTAFTEAAHSSSSATGSTGGTSRATATGRRIVCRSQLEDSPRLRSRSPPAAAGVGSRWGCGTCASWAADRGRCFRRHRVVAISLACFDDLAGVARPDEPDSKAARASSARRRHFARARNRLNPPLHVMAIVLPPDKQIPDKHLPGSMSPTTDPVWKANPGGEALSRREAFGRKSREARIKGGRTRWKENTGDGSRAILRQGSQTIGSPYWPTSLPNGALPHDASSSPTGLQATRIRRPSAPEPSPLPAASTNQSTLNGVLSSKASLPASLCSGIARGYGRPAHASCCRRFIRHRQRAATGRQVVLDAMVMEDGTVRDVKSCDGSPALARSAVDAVKHWRYKPYCAGWKTSEERDQDQRSLQDASRRTLSH